MKRALRSPWLLGGAAIALCVVLALVFGVGRHAAVDAPAAGASYKSGADYLTLPEQQNLDGSGKIEVTEFFAYYCPHCARFEPLLHAWVQKNAGHIVFKRVHVSGSGPVAAQQRLFYTLDALGLADQYQQRVFDAIHVQQQRLATEQEVFDWAAQAGIDPARFSAVWNSFGVQSKLRRASTLMTDYRIDSWPTVAVDGHYLTSPSQAGEGDSHLQSETQMQEGALKVMDFLVAKAKAEAARK